jgi:uncharacterized protein
VRRSIEPADIESAIVRSHPDTCNGCFKLAQERDRSGPGQKASVISLIYAIYKTALSPILHFVSPTQCIYLPTCSEYAYSAVSRFGTRVGLWLAFRRLIRCHPWGKGGFDPLPDPHTNEPSTDGSRAERLS